MAESGVKYASSGGASLAYREGGTGPPLLSFGNFATNLEALETLDLTRRFMRLMSSVCRMIRYDQRGTGLSDRSSPRGAVLDVWVDDAVAVLDDAGVGKAFVLGMDFSGPLAVAFAARYPDRTSGLVLWGTYASLVLTPDYPLGAPPELRQRLIDSIVKGWGDPESEFNRRALPNDGHQAERDAAATIQRQSIGRGELRAMVETMFQIDVRNLLVAVEAPTLVMHRREDAMVPVEYGQYLAEHIPAAELLELPGDEHFIMVGDVERAVAEIARFCRSRLPVDEARALAVIVFIDIADSTKRAAAVGDLQWRRLLDEHDDVVRDYLDLFGGRPVKWVGDGVLATFPTPSRAIRCSLAISQAAEGRQLPVRIGMHAGEFENRGDDIAGVAVHIAQRVEASAAAGEVRASQTVRDLVTGSEFQFGDCGLHELKGVPGEWHLFTVSNP